MIILFSCIVSKEYVNKISSKMASLHYDDSSSELLERAFASI